jgi:hypothetical protein
VLGYRVVVWNSFQSMPVPYAGATLSVLLQCLFDRFGSVFP